MKKLLCVSGTFLVALCSILLYQIYLKPIKLTHNCSLQVVPGMSLKALTQHLVIGGVIERPNLFTVSSRMRMVSKKLQAGDYLIPVGISLYQLMRMFVEGQVAQYPFTIVEGWTLDQVLTALSRTDNLKHTVSKQSLVATFHTENLEGFFFPDTYFYDKGSRDIDILKRAHQNMQKKIEDIWHQRHADLILKTPTDAVKLASIIQKESSKISEYREISGVYVRRLEQKIRLQADPCVAYGLKLPPHKQLSKKDLKKNTPYNTYLHHGLPPTPIAMPGYEALLAAVTPARGKKNLYFVADGKGGHIFSETFAGHILAIQKYRSRKGS